MKRPGRRAAFLGGLVAAGMAALSGGALLSFTGQDTFPHDKHAGLFPTCVGCHAGMAEGDTARFVSIAPEDCAGCHDGTTVRRVDWSGYQRPASNLAFPHPTHVAVLQMECTMCHNPPDAPNRMTIVRAVVPTCLGCHASGADGHFDFAKVDCATCHKPLTQVAALTPERIAAFPIPPSHLQPDFVFVHGAIADSQASDCAVCHARESCERCHLNGERLAPIASLGSDARVAGLVAGRAGRWPEPPSHQQEDWLRVHGASARADIEECASCHAQQSCAACHGEGGPAVVARLPRSRSGGPTGVVLSGVLAGGRPASHTVDWIANHGTAAALGTPNCTTCHTEQQCVACHDGANRPAFHPVDFVARHGAEAFAEELECAACHSREGFCRDCHMAVGVGVSGTPRTGGAYHDAVPDWLLAHGLAARQDLEACTTCHAQSSCLRCHSAKAGLRVSPHGPDFDPDRIADRSTMSCAICHFEIPGRP